MEKTSKNVPIRLIALILALAMCFGLFPVVNAGPITYSYRTGGFGIGTPYASDSCFITYLDDENESVENLIVPATLDTPETYPWAGKLHVIGLSEGAFIGNEHLKSVTLPDSIKVISNNAFNGCTNITSIKLPSQLEYLGNGAFKDNHSLTSIALPDTVKDVVANIDNGPGQWSYYETDSYTIPKENFEGESWFANCYNLKDVKLSNSITSIGYSCFADCTSLEKIDIPDKVRTVGKSAFNGCENLKTVDLPDGLETIETYAFANCNSLKSITIPKSVTEIGNNAFWGSGLETIYGYRGTAAEQYANDNQIRFVPLDGTGSDSDDLTFLSIAIYSTKKNLNMFPGEKLSLGFAMVEKTGTERKIDDNWKKMAITISNPDIISISDYRQAELGYVVDVEALKPGTTNVLISDTDSGAYQTVTFTVKENGPSYTTTMDEFGSHREFQGIYIDNYNYHFDEKTKQYNISFDAYNEMYFSAAVDIFDENGNWINAEEIKPFNNPHNIKDVEDGIYYIITDFDTEEGYRYDSGLMSKHTEVSFNVPNGGYFTISNNAGQSIGTFFFNLINLAFDVASEMIFNSDESLVDDVDSYMDDFCGIFMKHVKETSIDVEGMMEKTLKKKVVEMGKKGVKKSSTDKTVNEMYSFWQDTFSSLKFNWNDVNVTSNKVLQSIIQNASPWGAALKFIFKVLSIVDYYLLCTQYLNSIYNQYYTVYSTGNVDSHFLSNSNYGIRVTKDATDMPKAVTQVFRVPQDDTLFDNLDNKAVESEFYNICLIQDDETVQPNGKVKVYIPVPAGLKAETCTVYRKENDGTWTNLLAKREGAYLMFETNHFSLYAIVGELSTLSISTLPQKTKYNIDEQLDTTGLKLLYDGQEVDSGFYCNPIVFDTAGECEVKVTYGYGETSFTVNVKDNEAVEPEEPEEPTTSPKLPFFVNGIVKGLDGKWAMYKNGVVDTTYTGIAPNLLGWWRVKDGYVDFNANGIYKNQFGWWKTTNGRVTFLETGIYKNEYGWWRVVNSKVDFKANGIYKNSYGWWKTTNGKVTFDENGVFKNEFGWWYVKNSKVDFTFTGIASNKYGTWYIKNGKVDFTKNGKVDFDGKTYQVTFGKAKLA